MHVATWVARGYLVKAVTADSDKVSIDTNAVEVSLLSLSFCPHSQRWAPLRGQRHRANVIFITALLGEL